MQNLALILHSEDEVEADSYTLFSKVMDHGHSKTFQLGSNSKYNHNLDKNDKKNVNEILRLSKHIFEEKLAAIDLKLYAHLKALDVEPQIFML